jgi:hypothetical protein
MIHTDPAREDKHRLLTDNLLFDKSLVAMRMTSLRRVSASSQRDWDKVVGNCESVLAADSKNVRAILLLAIYMNTLRRQGAGNHRNAGAACKRCR